MRTRLLVTVAVLVGLVGGVPASAALLPGGNSSTVMTVSGHVLASTTGAGVPGMCVVIEGQFDGMPGYEVGRTTTDANGHYRVSWTEEQQGWQSGPYDAVATADCGARGWWQQTTYDNLPVSTSPGHTTASGINMTTHPAGRITGRIVDSQYGKPLPDIAIWATRSTSGPAPDGGHAQTAADGTFVLGGLGSAGYVLNAFPANPDEQFRYLSEYVPHQPTVTTAKVFTVTVGATTVVNASMLRAGAIAGKVTDKRTGLPLKGISVSVTSLTGKWNSYSEDVTSRDGTYEAPGLGPGTYAVCFHDTSAPTTAAPRCYKDQPYPVGEQNSWRYATPVSLPGYGVVVHNINQALPFSLG